MNWCYLIREASLMLRVIGLNKPLTFSIKHWCFRVCIISCVSVSSVFFMHSFESEPLSGLSGHASWASAELCSTQTLCQRGQTQQGLPAGGTVLSGGKALWYFGCFKNNILTLHSVSIIIILYTACFYSSLYYSVKQYHFSFIEIILLSGLCSVFMDF